VAFCLPSGFVNVDPSHHLPSSAKVLALLASTNADDKAVDLRCSAGVGGSGRPGSRRSALTGAAFGLIAEKTPLSKRLFWKAAHQQTARGPKELFGPRRINTTNQI